jgi:hypothetical protein
MQYEIDLVKKLPLKIIPLREIAELTKQAAWMPVGKYGNDLLKHLYPLELGTDGEFRYAYESIWGK